METNDQARPVETKTVWRCPECGNVAEAPFSCLGNADDGAHRHESATALEGTFDDEGTFRENDAAEAPELSDNANGPAAQEAPPSSPAGPGAAQGVEGPMSPTPAPPAV